MPAPTQGDSSWIIMTAKAQPLTPGVLSWYQIGGTFTTYDSAQTFCSNMMNPAPCQIIGQQTGNFVQLVDGSG